MKKYIKIILSVFAFVIFLFISLNETYDNSFKDFFIKDTLENKKEKQIQTDIKNIIEKNFAGYKGTLSYAIHFYDDDVLITSDNIQDKLKSASLIKLFICEYVFCLEKEGELSFDAIIKGYTVSSLIENMITISDNNATNILIDYLGFDKINEFIISKGYTKTTLERKMLDTKAQKEGRENYTSADDVLGFLDNLYSNKDEKINDSILSIMKRQKVSTKIRKYLLKDTIIANKTGELSDTQNDAGIVFSPYGDFSLVFITNGANSHDAIDMIAKSAKDIYTYKINQNTTK